MPPVGDGHGRGDGVDQHDAEHAEAGQRGADEAMRRAIAR